MAWDKGFDFRGSSGYVSDPTDCTYVLATDAYTGSVIRNSVAFGWTILPSQGLDRSTAVPRLAGINYSTYDADFRIDLPASGDYVVYLAMGDAASAQTNQRVIVLDSTTPKITIGPHNTNSNEYYDAADTNRTAAAWVSASARGGTGVTVTFATTTCIIRLDTNGANPTCLAHVFLSQVVPVPPGGDPLKPIVAVEANLSGVWTNLAADVVSSEAVVIRHGIPGSGLGDRMASTGTARFVLRNDAKNSASLIGYYSLFHANKRSGWGLGIGLRVKLTDPATGVVWTRFQGSIDVVDPIPGLKKERRVMVVASDWLDDAANWAITPEVGAQINKRDDEIITTILAAMPTQPTAVDLDAGREAYPYALDTSEGRSAFSEFTKLAFSGLTYIYLKANGTLRSESRYQRLLDTTNDWTITDADLVGLTLPSTRDDVLNSVRVIEHPKVVDSATNVYSQANAIYVGPGETKQLLGPYRDPVTGEQIGATDIEGLAGGTVLAVTYYGANTQEDGSGGDVTADFAVVVTAGPSGARFQVTNSGGSGGWLTRLELYGNAIHDHGTVTYEARDVTSIAAVGERVAILDMQYQSAGIGQGAAEYLLAKYKNPFAQARTITVVGSSVARLTQILSRDISDRLAVTETITGVNNAFFINGVELRVTQAQTEATYTLAPAQDPAAGVYWVLGTSTAGTTTNPAPF